MGSIYTVRQSPADGCPAGGSSSSCSHRPAQMSSGGSSSTGLRHQTSSPTRNGAYLEGNRSASSPSPEQEDAARPSSKNPLTWTVDDVVWFVKDADPQALGPHVELFRKHVCRRLPLPPLGNLNREIQPAYVTHSPSNALGFLNQIECRAWRDLWRVWAKEISLIP
uniref:SAM domain-containing protein n=1 Tax=Taeniopygia guttata TaxID=59729 RepID=A0A674GE75_TAEGU